MANITFTRDSNLNDSIFGKSQVPIRKIMTAAGEAFEQQSIADKLFCKRTSNHFGEKVSSMTPMAGPQPVVENEGYPVDGFQEGYSKVIEHTTWKDSFAVSKEAIEDAKVFDLKSQPKAFINAYYRQREKFAAALFGAALKGNATATFAGKKFDVTSADNNDLFADAHACFDSMGTSQFNWAKDAFSADALAYAEEHMQQLHGETDDQLLGIIPDTIIIPNDAGLKKAVFAAIGADKDPATANNGFNFTFGRWNVIVWSYLNNYITANTQPWILASLNYNQDVEGAVWYDRKGLEVHSMVDPNTDANIWKLRARWSAGFADWRPFMALGCSDASNSVVPD